MNEIREDLAKKLDRAFSKMINAVNERDYMYYFGQFNAYLSVLFTNDMITFDEYNMLTDAKTSFYFSSIRKKVVFNGDAS